MVIVWLGLSVGCCYYRTQICEDREGVTREDTRSDDGCHFLEEKHNADSHYDPEKAAETISGMLMCAQCILPFLPHFISFSWATNLNRHTQIHKSETFLLRSSTFPHTTLFPTLIARECDGWHEGRGEGQEERGGGGGE